MKTILKAIGLLLGVLIVAGLGWLIYFNSTHPKVAPAKDIHIEATPERLERGKYLATVAANCIDCHSKRDVSKYSMPVIAGTEGMGGEMFDKTIADIPGV